MTDRILGFQVVLVDEQGQELERIPDVYPDFAAIVVGDYGYRHLPERDGMEEGQKVRQVLESYGPGVLVINGGARGADTCAKDAARALDLNCITVHANWKTHGKAAGPIRNQQMLDEGKPDLVLAFHDDLGRSKGTNDMLSRAEKANIPTRLINHRQPAATA